MPMCLCVCDDDDDDTLSACINLLYTGRSDKSDFGQHCLLSRDFFLDDTVAVSHTHDTILSCHVCPYLSSTSTIHHHQLFSGHQPSIETSLLLLLLFVDRHTQRLLFSSPHHLI